MKFPLIFASITIATCLQNSEAYDHKPRTLRVRTTAYTHTEADHLGFGKKNAISTNLQSTRKYTSAASDWSRFPLGTEFRIVGINRHFIIDDYGCALCGKDTIDLYFPSKKEMNRWGARHVGIIITKYGDFEKSRKILSHRTKWYHCRKMLSEIDKNKKNSSGTNYDNIPVPEIPVEINPALMASASIPENEWSLDAPKFERPALPEDSLLASNKTITDENRKAGRSIRPDTIPPSTLMEHAPLVLASLDLALMGVTSVDLASVDLASGDLASGDLASGDLASGDLASGDLASGDLPPAGSKPNQKAKTVRKPSNQKPSTSRTMVAKTSRPSAKEKANPLKDLGKKLFKPSSNIASGSTRSSDKSRKKNPSKSNRKLGRFNPVTRRFT